MTGVYNQFEIFFENGDPIRAKAIAEDLFSEADSEDELRKESDVDVSDDSISADIYCGLEEEDCEATRETFLELCKALVRDDPDSCFLGMHSFYYANADKTGHLLCFYKDKKLSIYYGEVVEDIGCLNAGKRLLSYEYGVFVDERAHQYDDYYYENDDDVDNDMMDVLEMYDYREFPEY